MEPVSTYKAFKYQWAVWRLTGLDPPKSPRLRIFYFTYAVILNTLITLMFPISLTVNCFFSSNLDELCCNLWSTATNIMCNLKLLNVFIKRKKLFEEVKAITTKLDRRAISKEECAILESGIKLSHRVFLTLITFYFPVVFGSVLMILLPKELNLMFPAWYPLDWKNSKFDWILANGHQFLCIVVASLQNCANDTYPQAYLTILASHFKVLSFRFQKIAKDPKRSPAENYQDLIECIEDHQEILRLNEMVKEILSPVCFAQFIATGVGQCTMAFYCLQTDFDLAGIAVLIASFTIITLETYVLCHFGNVLMNESEELTTAICSCNWTDQSKEFKSTLLFIIHGSQRENVIMAGRLIAVSLPTFVTVMKTTYLYFTVLLSFRK